MNLEKVNKKLTETSKYQITVISTLRNSIQELQNSIMTDRLAKQPNDAVVEDTGNNISKRILLHTDTDVLSVVTTHSAQIQKLQTDVASLKNGSQPQNTDLLKLQTDVAALKANGSSVSSGSTYVRWGRNTCSGNGTELVYSGFAAGSHYTDKGAAANHLCLSPDPLWGHYQDAHDARGLVMGVEYEFTGTSRDRTPWFHKYLREENAPCSV